MANGRNDHLTGARTHLLRTIVNHASEVAESATVKVGDIVFYFDRALTRSTAVPINAMPQSLAVISKVTDRNTVTLQCISAADLEAGPDGVARPKKGHYFGTPFRKNVPRYTPTTGARPTSPHWQMIQ